jgi:excisionase family DNA binding protein
MNAPFHEAVSSSARKMGGRRKPSGHRAKIHRSYTVDEVARLLGVAKGTVRRWIKAGLSVLADRKPALILGEDLVQFLAARKAPRKKCGPAECYCVKCREPRKPAGAIAEFIPLRPRTGNLRAICPVCGCLMHRQIRCDAVDALRALLEVTIVEPVSSLKK